MKNKKIKISIFIPTKNAGKEFEKTLNQISIQDNKSFEVIIVDSSPTNQTIKITEKFKDKFPLKIYKIPPEEFGHGKTRNLALKYSSKSSEFIVFLTQDAIPANNRWLSNLLSNFKDAKIAGVFSRQIPKKNARITEVFFYKENFPNKKIIRPSKNYNIFPYNIFFSNVSSAIRKDLLEKYPFDETLIMSEDQKWAKTIIQKGYKTIYEPKSIVIHSHNYTLKQTFQRYFDSAFSLNEIQKGNFDNFTKKGADYMIREFQYVLKKKPFFIPYLSLYNLSKILGTTLGMHEHKLPLFLKEKFSLHSYFWK